MTFPNLSDIIAAETQGEYTFEHIDIDGYNTLYLKHNEKVVMYDMANRPIKDIYEANMNLFSGDVLIAGAGIGFCVFPIKDLPGIKSITVLEEDATVIAMLQPYLPNVTFIQADATSYVPSKKFDSIFLDIWGTASNLEKYSDTIRYKDFLSIGGYLNYLDFEAFYRIVPVTIKEIDYTIQGYHKRKVTDAFGDRALVEYFAEFKAGTYSNLKVTETRTHVRQAVTGILETVIVDIKWIGADGVTAIATKQLIKHLDLDDGLAANEKARKRLLHKAKVTAISLIGLVAGKLFMRSLGGELGLYVEGDQEPLIASIAASSESQEFKSALIGILDVLYV